MAIRVKIVIFSHLSDMEYESKEIINLRSNFIKFLLNKFSDLEIEIDADKEYKEFLNK